MEIRDYGTTGAKATALGALQKNNGNEAERQKKMDDENDVFQRTLRLLAEYRAVHREDCRSGQGRSSFVFCRGAQKPAAQQELIVCITI